MDNYKDMISKYTEMANENSNVIKNIKLIRRVFGFINFFLDAFVLMALWNWFLVPVGVVHIGYVMAFGISLLIAYFNSDMLFGAAIHEIETHGTLQHAINMLITAWLRFTTLLLLLVFGFVISLLV